jgi:hypothetical protein
MTLKLAVERFCECGNGNPRLIKEGEFLDQISNDQLFKRRKKFEGVLEQGAEKMGVGG